MVCSSLFADLVAGRHEGAWARRGDWSWDTRVELTGVNRGDFATWRHDPRGVADGYLPAVTTAAQSVTPPSEEPRVQDR